MMGAASKDAYAMAGIAPADVDLAEIYDAFSVATLQGLEATGLCAPGEAGAFVEAGGIGPGGQLPVNTDGGGLTLQPSRAARALPAHRRRPPAARRSRRLAGPRPTNALISATGSAYMGVQGSAVTILSKER